MIGCSPSRTRLSESGDFYENRVSFLNVKTTYPIDEDLILNYTLQEEFKSSTRDWIGIFPRNWSNLQQYLTFEYTLSSPPTATNFLNRTIWFPRIFHRGAPLNLEYQFVYVSKEIQIMGTSTYFRFTPLPCNNTMAKQCTCTTNICSSAEVLSNTTINKIEATQGVRPTCRYCHRKICGLKIDALRGDFLATLSDSLLDRVHRLERDLSFAESALKNAKGARENLAKRLHAYEAFVAEMLKSLAVRGVVKITDVNGIEIILQRVNENNCLADATRANGPMEDEIVALKRLLVEQQQTIKKLTEERNFDVPQRDRANCVDREIQTISDPPLKFEPSAQHRLERWSTEEKLNECEGKNPTKINDKTKRANLPLEINTIGKEIETIGKEIETIDASKLFLRDIKHGKISSKVEAHPVVLKIPKPSGVLVQGKDVKFAIVRF